MCDQYYYITYTFYLRYVLDLQCFVVVAISHKCFVVPSFQHTAIKQFFSQELLGEQSSKISSHVTPYADDGFVYICRWFLMS